MNSVFSKIIVSLLSLFGIIFFGYQIYVFLYSPYETQITQLYPYNDQVELNGVAIKEEVLIENQHDGIIKYIHANSQKVVNGDAIAKVYSAQLDLMNDNLIEDLNTRLSLLNELNQKKITGTTNIQSVIANSSKLQLEIINDTEQNDFNGLDKSANDFLSLLLKQQLALTPQMNFDEQIAATQNRINELSGQITTPAQTIVAPTSGYFTNYADGYETVLTKDVLNNLSVESVTALINDTTPQDTGAYLGKMLSTTEWRFISLVKTKDISRFEQNSTVNMIFSMDTSQKVTAKVEQVVNTPDKEYGVVVFKSNIMNSEIINIRKETPIVLFNSSSGLRVNKSALRMIDDVPGVYINQGQVVRFKKIDVLYESENYIYSKVVDDTEYLQLYDEVIIEGKDLYDDKPIR